MSKLEIKELAKIIIFIMINTIIAFGTTILMGVYNTIALKTFSALYGDITWEGIIFIVLSLIEANIYEILKIYCIKQKNLI